MKIHRLSKAFFVAITLPIACQLPVWAQVSQLPSSIPAQVNSGLLTRPNTDSLQEQEKITPQKPESEIRLDLPQRPVEVRASSSQAFLVRAIYIQGSTMLPTSTAKEIATPYVGKEQTLESLDTLVGEINKFYRDKGYLTTEAYIPPQNIENGELTINVQEGHIGDIRVQGNRFYRARVIGRGVSQHSGELLNFRKLEDDLNRVNRTEDRYKLKAFLSAGNKPGETHVTLRIAERQPLQITPTFDNQGRYMIGLYRGGVNLRHDSLLTMGDRLQARWIGSTGTQIATGAYSVPLNRWGTEVTGTFAYSHVNVDLRLPFSFQPKLTSQMYMGGVTMSQPLDRDRRWTVDTTLNWQKITNYFEEFEESSTRIHSLQSGLTYSGYDRFGRTFARVQNTVGIATARHSLGFDYVSQKSTYWKMEGMMNRLVFLPKNNLLIFRAYGQMTPQVMPMGESYQLGGVNSVRGFTEGVLVGDRGFSVGIEHRFPIPGLSKISPWLGQRVQGAWFYDFGRVWKDPDNPSFVPGRSDLIQTTLLQGVGIGCRAQLTRFLQGFVDFGFGLGDRKDIELERQQPTARVHFGIRSDMLPQDYRMRNQKVHVLDTPNPLQQIPAQYLRR